MSRNIAVVVGASGWVLWAASLATPIAILEKGQFLGLQSAPEVVIRGWEVARDSIEGLRGLWQDPGDILQVLLGLGNAIIVVSPYALFTRHAKLRRSLCVLGAAEALALAGMYAAAEGWTWAGLGYWLWLSSFVLVSASLAIVPASGRVPVREPAS